MNEASRAKRLRVLRVIFVYDFGSRYITREFVCDARKAAQDASFRVSVA